MVIAQRTFVSYIDKSREYYAAHGYPAPYRWARHDDAPFTALSKPLAEATVGVVTTTRPTAEHSLRPWHLPSDPPPDRLFTDSLSWDKDATHTDDTESYVPVRRLAEFADTGHIGAVSPRFYGSPTLYSQRRTNTHAEQIEQWCREDGVDLVLLVAL